MKIVKVKVTKGPIAWGNRYYQIGQEFAVVEAAARAFEKLGKAQRVEDVQRPADPPKSRHKRRRRKEDFTENAGRDDGASDAQRSADLGES